VISKGTVSDKMAAYVLLLQDDPVVNFHYLKNMIGMVKVSKKRECFMVVGKLGLHKERFFAFLQPNASYSHKRFCLFPGQSVFPLTSFFIIC